jgi:outer membrane protein OmpA-like peptidoglycan-associated protein
MSAPRRALSFLLVFAAAVWATPARAQGTDTSIDVNTYWPAPGPGNYFGVRGAAIAPHLGVGFSLDLNYQHRPLTLTDLASGEDIDAVQYQVTADFLWSLGLFNWVQIGLALPTVLAMDGAGASPLDDTRAELATTAIRDLRIDLKSRFIGRDRNGIVRDGFGLALAASLSVPTGDRENFAGDRNVVGEPVLIADYNHRYFSVAANVGARLRAASRFADAEVGHQLTFGVAGAGYLVDRRLQLFAELYGLFGLTGTDTVTDDLGNDVEILGNEPHLEIRGGIGYTPDRERDITILVGGGAGLMTDTPGVPQFRVLASLRYQPQNRDADEDGVFDRDDGCDDAAEDMDEFDDEDGCPDPDNDEDEILDGNDECPDEAEDMDSFQDEDGCPDLDNDGDEIADEDDECPAEAEDRDEHEDDDGCPDGDNDGDEVADADDRCPTEAEDRDGHEDGDGCPDPDNDGDEIADGEDRCPNEAEDQDQFEDEDGCPDPDNDGDGVLDADDRCADQAETINGLTDGDGCTDRGAGVTVGGDAFTLRGPARFGRGAATISEALRGQLAQVALHLRTAALRGRTVVIRGLADAAGDTEANRALARSRAEAVRDALTAAGVSEARVEVEVGDLTGRPAALQLQLSLSAAE